MTEPAKKPIKKIIAVVLGAIVLAWTFISIADGDGGQPRHSQPGIARGQAWDACKDAVREELRNPATADFAILSTDIARHGAGWSIVGSVTADNDFGVEREIGYSCEISADGHVEAHVS